MTVDNDNLGNFAIVIHHLLEIISTEGQKQQQQQQQQQQQLELY